MDCCDCQNGSDVDRNGVCRSDDGGIVWDFGCTICYGIVNDGKNGNACLVNANGSVTVVCKVMDSECGFSVLDHET